MNELTILEKANSIFFFKNMAVSTKFSHNTTKEGVHLTADESSNDPNFSNDRFDLFLGENDKDAMSFLNDWEAGQAK